MPEIGEIRKAIEVGFRGNGKRIWAACSDCGKERWVSYIRIHPQNPRCVSCARRLTAKLKGRPQHENKGTINCPETGDIRYGDKIAYQSRTTRFIWQSCIVCGRKRWVMLIHNQPLYTHCYSCASKLAGAHQRGGNHPQWQGGRIKRGNYIFIKLQPDDFFYPMAEKSGYIREHRLVVAKALGRNLHSWEIVHHKGAKYPKGSKEDKADNRYPENLQLVTDDRHRQITILESKIGRLEKRIEEQNKRIKLLEWLFRELNKTKTPHHLGQTKE